MLARTLLAIGQIVLVLTLFYSTIDQSMAMQTKEGKETIDQRATITESIDGRKSVNFDLGEIAGDSQVDCVLTLRNSSSKAMVFIKLVSTCSCLKATADSSEIPAEGETKLHVTLKTPKVAKSRAMLAFLYLDSGNGRGVNVRIEYQLRGMLCFTERSAVVRATEGVPITKFQIPVLFTSPVSIHDVSATCSDGLTPMKTKLVDTPEGMFLNCSIETAKGVSGTISLKDAISGRVASIPCVVDMEPAVSVVPSIMYFVKSDADDSHIATAILKVSNRYLTFPSEDEKVFEKQIEIDCELDSGNSKLDVKRIATGVYRISLVISPKLDENGKSMVPTEAFWSADTGSFNLKARSKIKFP